MSKDYIYDQSMKKYLNFHFHLVTNKTVIEFCIIES